MPKLYEVEITITAVVLADDEVHAYSVARGEYSEICRDDPRDGIFVLREIKHADQLPDGWDDDCNAYGGHLGQSTLVGDYLVSRPVEPERDTKTIDMFEVAPGQHSEAADD